MRGVVSIVLWTLVIWVAFWLCVAMVLIYSKGQTFLPTISAEENSRPERPASSTMSIYCGTRNIRS
jgi:hypothetical protein